MLKSVPYNPKREEFFSDCEHMEMNEMVEKWFLDTLSVRIERWGILITERLGIYRMVKRIVRKILGKE